MRSHLESTDTQSDEAPSLALPRVWSASVAAVVAVLALATAPNARATQMTSCSASESVDNQSATNSSATGCSLPVVTGTSAYSTSDSFDVTTYNTDTQTAAGQSITDSFSFTQSGQAWVSGTLGTFHGAAFAEATRSPAYYTYTFGDDQVTNVSPTSGSPTLTGGGSTVMDNTQGLAASARAYGQWTDLITVEDPGAPDGTVTLSVAVALDAVASPCTVFGDQVASLSSAGVGLSAFSGTGQYLGSAAETKGAYGLCQTPTNRNTTATFTVPVGTVISLNGSFAVSAAASLFASTMGDFADTRSASVDAADTGHFYVDVLTPGAFYVDESGATNPFASPPATAVPEPGSLLLMASGLLAGWSVNRRRQ